MKRAHLAEIRAFRHSRFSVRTMTHGASAGWSRRQVLCGSTEIAASRDLPVTSSVVSRSMSRTQGIHMTATATKYGSIGSEFAHEPCEEP